MAVFVKMLDGTTMTAHFTRKAGDGRHVTECVCVDDVKYRIQVRYLADMFRGPAHSDPHRSVTA